MIIRFKEVEDEAHLKTFLHFVPKIEYDLISGIKLSISEAELNKSRVRGFLPYNGVNIPFDLIEVNPSEEELSFGKEYSLLLNHLSEKFIHSKDVVDALYPGLVLKKNVLLYGRGGHGKSEMTEEFFDKALDLGIIKSKPFVQAFGEGLTEEALFGGIDIQSFVGKEGTGEYKYLVENSFMNHEIVVFEELFDAPAPILLSLKDIMTSGYFRKGNQIFKCKCHTIIGLTNKSKEDFSEDDSLEAFVQRFPVTKKVEWDSYTKVDFVNLFVKRFGKDSDFYQKHKVKLYDLASIIELNNMAGSAFVSPRTAMAAAELYAFGSSLDLISDIDKDITEKYFKENKTSELVQASHVILGKAKVYFESVTSSCKSIEGNEMEDDVLNMLSGDSTNFGMPKVLSAEDASVVKISVNKLTWALAHLQSSNVDTSLGKEKGELLSEITKFKQKLSKIIEV